MSTIKKEDATKQLENFAVRQQQEANHRKLVEKHAAQPEEAFKAPKKGALKDKNKQDRLLSACISLSLSAETEFKLFSYRVISPEQFQYNIKELVMQFTKTKNELS